jgi:NAD-dependent dihydropyrimidine dehydrogenase PreA subunit
MKRLKEIVLDLGQLFFRMVPHPTHPRLIVIGHPDRWSPVLVTTNCSLTVRRLVRALGGQSCFLLVAPAQGINVWCGAVGGHFTIESVISIVHTSGIEGLVDHRTLVLPVLAAPSINPRDLKRRLGWSAKLGPVRAADIPEFLLNGMKLTSAMRTVRFEVKDRLEMGVAMAGSIILRFSLFPLVVWGIRGMLLFTPTVLALSLLQMGWHSESSCGSHLTRKLAAHGVALAVLVFGCFLVSAPLQLSTVLEVICTAAGSVWLVQAASSGYTPFKQCSYSQAFYGQEPINIAVVEEDCTGCAICEQVCPLDCFERLPAGRAFDITHPERCVECRACLVQCPTGAVVNLHNLDLKAAHERGRCAA